MKCLGAEDEAFGEGAWPISEKQTRLIRDQLAGMIQFALSEPGEGTPPEQGTGETAQGAPRGIKSSHMRQLMRERRGLLLRREDFREAHWQNNHGPPYAEGKRRGNFRTRCDCQSSLNFQQFGEAGGSTL